MIDKELVLDPAGDIITHMSRDMGDYKLGMVNVFM